MIEGEVAMGSSPPKAGNAPFLHEIDPDNRNWPRAANRLPAWTETGASAYFAWRVVALGAGRSGAGTGLLLRPVSAYPRTIKPCQNDPAWRPRFSRPWHRVPPPADRTAEARAKTGSRFRTSSGSANCTTAPW